MTGRDRIVAIVLGVVAIWVVVWMVLVSPERQKASKLSAQVASAQSQLSAADGKLASARAAQAQYATAYAAVVSLGKAVPPGEEVPSLIYQISRASHQKSVQFSSIVAGGASSSPSATASTPSSSGSSTSAASAGASTAAFTAMPFTFIFEGGFFDLERLFRSLTNFTTAGPNGSLNVSGRLLTIQSVKLSPDLASSQSGPAGAKPAGTLLSGTITASAYVLPAGQGLTGSATPGAPAGASPSPASSSPASSPTPPAVARVP